MVNLVIFASGEGSNAEKILEFFEGHKKVKISWIITNNEEAGVLKKAQKYRKGIQVISNSVLIKNAKQFTEFLHMERIDWIILAGFLLKIPTEIVQAFPNKIINLHPSLLPKFGGKGMYGIHVHRAVIASAEKESGITIHLVNEEYDKGEIVFQQTCLIEPGETPETLSSKVQQLEHKFFPKIIEKVILENQL